MKGDCSKRACKMAGRTSLFPSCMGKKRESCFTSEEEEDSTTDYEENEEEGLDFEMGRIVPLNYEEEVKDCEDETKEGNVKVVTMSSKENSKGTMPQ